MTTRGATAVLMAIATLALAGPAHGHGDVRRSAPGDGAGLAQAPDEVWIEFTEPPARQARLEVTDPCGRRVESGPVAVQGPRATVPIEAGAKGEYSVRFAVVSTVDGHTSRGLIRFAVARGDGCETAGAAPDTGAAPPVEAAPEEVGLSAALIALVTSLLIGFVGGRIYLLLTRPD